MNVIRVTRINDDGSVLFDGAFGPNEVRYMLEHGVNFILTTGAQTIEEALDDEDEDDDEPFEVEGTETVQ